MITSDLPVRQVITSLSEMSVVQIKATLRFIHKIVGYRFSNRDFAHAVLMNQAMDNFREFDPYTPDHAHIDYNMVWMAKLCKDYLARNDVSHILIALLKFWEVEPRGLQYHQQAVA